MKRKIDWSVLIGIIVSLLVLVICIVYICVNCLVEEANFRLRIADFLADSMVTFLALAISVARTCQSRKQAKIILVVNILAVLACVTGVVTKLAGANTWMIARCLSLFFVLVGMSITKRENIQQTVKENGQGSKQVVKTIAGVLAAIMMIVAIVSFVNGTPAFAISDGIIYIFALVIVLIVWDSVESFSLGNLVILSKKVKDKDQEITKLSDEKMRMEANYHQLLSIVQNKQVFNVEINNGRGQVEADIQDDSRPEDHVEDTKDDGLEHIKNDGVVETEDSVYARRLDSIEELIARKAIEKFANKNNISSKELQMNVRFSRDFLESDPIMNRNVSFDAYVKRALDEMFLEVRFAWHVMSMRERLYYALSQINRYANINKANVKMIVIVPKLTEASASIISRRGYSNSVREMKFVHDRFALAIRNGIIEFAEIEITDEEIGALQAKRENK